MAEKVIANVHSIGFASSSCTVPAKGSPTLQLGDDEIEFGVGIHGEPGMARTTMLSADALAAKLLEHLFKDSSYKSGEIAVLVNGFGTRRCKSCMSSITRCRRFFARTTSRFIRPGSATI